MTNADSMRIAIIADIHGNLTALEAVLADIEAQHAAQIVCLGDVAATGSQPHETIERLKTLNCPVVMGNADAWLLNPEFSESDKEESRQFLDIGRWTLAQLSTADLDYLRTFQPTLQIKLDEGCTLLCYHGSPHSYDDVITYVTADDDLAQMLSGFSSTVMVGGHTHAQLLRRYQTSIVMNPGSVGLPFERLASPKGARNPPWAEYAILDCTSGTLSIEMRRVPVNVGLVIQAIRDSGMPHSAWLAADWG